VGMQFERLHPRLKAVYPFQRNPLVVQSHKKPLQKVIRGKALGDGGQAFVCNLNKGDYALFGQMFSFQSFSDSSR